MIKNLRITEIVGNSATDPFFLYYPTCSMASSLSMKTFETVWKITLKWMKKSRSHITTFNLMKREIIPTQWNFICKAKIKFSINSKLGNMPSLYLFYKWKYSTTCCILLNKSWQFKSTVQYHLSVSTRIQKIGFELRVEHTILGV